MTGLTWESQGTNDLQLGIYAATYSNGPPASGQLTILWNALYVPQAFTNMDMKIATGTQRTL